MTAVLELPDTGSHLDNLAFLGLMAIAGLVCLVVWTAARLMWARHLQERVTAAWRAFRGRPAWSCEVCGEPVAGQGDLCRRDLKIVRSTEDLDQPYDQEKTR